MIAMRPVLLTLTVWLAAAVSGAESVEISTKKELAQWAENNLEPIRSFEADVTMSVKLGPFKVQSEGTSQGKGDAYRSELHTKILGNTTTTRSIRQPDGVQWKLSRTGDGPWKIERQPAPGMPAVGAEESGQEMLEQGGFADAFDSALDNDEVTYVGQDTWNGEPVFVFSRPVSEEAKRKIGENPIARRMAKLDKVVSSFARSDGFPREIRLVLENGKNLSTIEFTGVQINVPLDDNLFQYGPPEGAEVKELPPPGADGEQPED